MMFVIFMFVIIIQRLCELLFAKSNEKWMKGQGAQEFGRGHYLVIVLMHSLFFVVLLFEKFIFEREISALWPFLLIVFVFAQFVRVWALASLGKYWNTKILVMPNVDAIRKGPYRYIKHPNYLVVSIELLVIPLLFGAYFTACLFTIMNVIVLSIRIPAEEKALKELTEYECTFQSCNRFLPNLLNKFDK